jgi:hypothetical protein
MWTASAPGGHSTGKTALLTGNSENPEFATGQHASMVHGDLSANLPCGKVVN